MADMLVIAVLAVVLFLAIRFIVKEKKSGRKCIGCPSSGSCSKCNCDHSRVSD